MSPPRMVEILREYGTERMLVNSAADWGRSDPLLTRARPAEAMLAAGFTDDDVDRVLWRNPVEFYGQSGRLDLDDVADAERHLRGQLDPARRRLMRLRHPTGRPCTWLLHQRAPRRGPRRHPRPARHVRGADPRAARRRRARPRPVAGRAGRRRAGRRRRRLRRRLRRELDARGLEVVTLNGFPYAVVPGAGGQARRLPPGLDRPAHGSTTPWTWPGCWPTCCPTTPPAARSPRCRWPGGSRGTTAGPARRRARSTSWPPGWPTLALADRPAGAGRRSSPSRAASWRPPTQAAALLSDVDTERLGVCLDLAHLACAWEDPAEALRPAARGRPAGGQGAGVRRAGGRRPGRGAPTVLRGVRRAAVPAPDPRRPAALAADDLDEALDRGDARAVAGALPRAAARRARAAARPRPCRCCARAARAARRRRPPVCDHLDVETYTWNVLPAGAAADARGAELAAGIAAELAFARDRAVARAGSRPR